MLATVGKDNLVGLVSCPLFGLEVVADGLAQILEAGRLGVLDLTCQTMISSDGAVSEEQRRGEMSGSGSAV